MNEQFEKAKDLYQHRLYSFAFYSLRVREDAEDVTQEALLRLWRHWDRIDRARLQAWLMQVAHNLVVDQIRRRRQEPRADGAEPDELPGGEAGRNDELFTLFACVERERLRGFAFVSVEPDEIVVVNARGNFTAILESLLKSTLHDEEVIVAAR